VTAKTIAKKLLECFKNGNKVLICGNGGSAQQANHFAAELIREDFPAISLCSDISVITATANDFGYKDIFSKQVSALGEEGDILIGISTSGKSENIHWAYDMADTLGVEVLDFPRKGKTTEEIQEYQLKLIHKIWRYIRQ